MLRQRVSFVTYSFRSPINFATNFVPGERTDDTTDNRAGDCSRYGTKRTKSETHRRAYLRAHYGPSDCANLRPYFFRVSFSHLVLRCKDCKITSRD